MYKYRFVMPLFQNFLSAQYVHLVTMSRGMKTPVTCRQVLTDLFRGGIVITTTSPGVLAVGDGADISSVTWKKKSVLEIGRTG